MAEYNFVRKTLDTLFKVVEVEFKVPLLGFGEIKLPVTEHVKEWWENKKRDDDLKAAIRRAEESFIAAHPDNKLAQILHGFPLHSEEEFQKVVAGLLTHLEEDNIIWLAEVKLEYEWDKLITKKEIREAIELYIPFLRHELNGIKEFRDIIAARMLERIDKRTERIEQKLDKVLLSKSDDIPANEPDYWNLKHPYPMPPNFTGRLAERAMLTQWLDGDSENRLFVLRALGGFGKSALAWQWLTHDVNPKTWRKVVFWSFYEGDASFEHFIEETLNYLKLEVPQGQRPQVDVLLKAIQSQKVLLILDGFERALRAYSNMNAAYQGDEPKIEENQLDCVNINAEIFLKSVSSLPNIKSKVLMTTRLTPRAVKLRGEFILGCHEVELNSMQPADAVEFFYKQKIKGTHSEIKAACALFGYHPLSLRLLAGRILKDFENPADIFVAQKLKIDGDLKAQKHHILEMSYKSLLPHKQNLLSTIACFRSPVKLHTLHSITEHKENLDNDLHDLIERGLIHFNEKNKKFDLHPIVRRYTYEHLTELDRVSIHTRLYNHFAQFPVPNTSEVQNIDDISILIEHFHHAVHASQYDEAYKLISYPLGYLLYFRFGAYQTNIDLLNELLVTKNNIPIYDEIIQAKILSLLGQTYSLLGNIRYANIVIQSEIAIEKKLHDKSKAINGLRNLADIAMLLGKFLEAEKHLNECLKSLPEESDLKKGVLRQLGILFAYEGKQDEAELKINNLPERFRHGRRNDLRVCAELAQYALLTNKPKEAFTHLNYALQLAYRVKNQRDIIRLEWLLGAAIAMQGNGPNTAAKYLTEALIHSRTINLVELEANILLDLARLRYNRKKYQESKSLADEALLITERCGYVLQGADVNLFLAQYALEHEKDNAKAKVYALEAKKLATCDGPPYYYKVAYEKAEAMLEKL